MSIRKLRFLASWNMGFHWFSIGIVIPVMTLYLLDKGLSLAQVGFAFAVYSGATVLLELPTGGLADTVGRKNVYLLSLLFMIAGALLLLFVKNPQILVFCFAFQGVSRSLSSGTMDAHFIDEFYRIDKNIDLQAEMARIGTAIPVGLGLGSLLGGFIPMTLGKITPSSFPGSPYGANYLVLIASLVVQMVTTALFVKEERAPEEKKGLIAGFSKVPEVIGTSLKYGTGHPVVLLILIAGFAWGFSISGLEQFWQPRVKSIITAETGSWIYGLLTTGYFLSAAAGNILATPLSRLLKSNHSLVLFLSRTIMGILYFLLALQLKIQSFSFFYIALFLFNSLQSSPESALFNGAIPSEKRSTLISFSSLFLQTGGILGSLLLGMTANRFSIKTAWVIASVVITASALLYLLIPLVSKNLKEPSANEF